MDDNVVNNTDARKIEIPSKVSLDFYRIQHVVCNPKLNRLSCSVLLETYSKFVTNIYVFTSVKQYLIVTVFNVRQKGGNLTLDGGNLIFTSRLPDGQPDFSWSC